MTSTNRWADPFILIEDAATVGKNSIAGSVSFYDDDKPFTYAGQITGSLLIESMAQLAAILLRTYQSEMVDFYFASIANAMIQPIPDQVRVFEIAVDLTVRNEKFITFKGIARHNAQIYCASEFTVFAS